MELDADTAGRLLRISGSYFRRLALSVGCRPVRTGKRSVWGVRHLLAVAVLPALDRAGVAPASAVGAARRIASASDEQLDACIKDGRSWLAVVGANVMPQLLFRDNVERMGRERADVLRAMGLTVTGLDIGPVWDDLQQALTAATATGDAAADITAPLND